jgi:hypothetical protein
MQVSLLEIMTTVYWAKLNYWSSGASFIWHILCHSDSHQSWILRTPNTNGSTPAPMYQLLPTPSACRYGFSTNINTPDWLIRVLHSGPTAPPHFFKRGRNQVDCSWYHAPDCCIVDRLSLVPWLSTSKYDPSACRYVLGWATQRHCRRFQVSLLEIMTTTG